MLRRGSGFPRLQSDIKALPFGSGVFDAVICGLATGHISAALLGPAFAEMGRVVRPCGTILFSDLHPYLYIRGGRRTFAAKDGRTHDVEHYPHLISDYFGAIDSAGFTISAIRERKATIDGRSFPAVLVIAAGLRDRRSR
jgi:SAM-dependent methyltransferase